ncbi:MAG: hypothetical protein WA146_09255 [Thiobacillus sp.]
MDSDVIHKLQARIDVLHKDRLRIDAEINEIKQALTVIGKYASSDYSSAAATMPALASSPRGPSKQQQILDAVVAILSDGNPRHTADLLAQLTVTGIDVGGDKPEANLSAYLSRGKDTHRLNSDRRYGWSLKKENPEDVDASSGSGADEKFSHLI